VMKQDNETPRMREILGRYRLDSPLSPEEKRTISSGMAPMFRRVLKGGGKYTFLSGIFLSIYFFFRRFGITITVTKAIVSIITAAGIVTGGYFLYLSLRGAGPFAGAEKAPVNAVSKSGDEAAKGRAASNFAVCIEPFSSLSVDRAVSVRASRGISSGLNRLRGAGFSRVASGGRGGRYMLLGNIETVEGAYILFIKLVDIRSSKIVYAVKEKARSVEDLEKTFSRISGNIASRIR
jgi:hypothetical protein